MQVESVQELKTYITDAVREAVKDMDSSPYLTRPKMAKWLGVSTSTLDTFIKQGLKVAYVNGRPYIAKGSVTAFFKARER